MSTVHPPTTARPIEQRRVPSRLLGVVWLVALLVAASVLGLWIAYGGSETTERPLLHVGPPAAGAGVTTTRTTFRDLSDPEHARVWTLERSYRTSPVGVPAGER